MKTISRYVIVSLVAILAVTIFLFAGCSGKTYVVTYNYNYEDAPAATVTEVGADDVLESPEAPVRSGYVFDAWYTDTAFTQKFDGFGSAITADLTLYAKWSEAVKVTVVYNNAQGSKEELIVKGGTIALETPTQSGFDFDGWFTDEALTIPFDATKAITADTTVYALWLEGGVTYRTVTYNMNYDGGSASTQKVKDGGFATRPSDYGREGYSLMDWYTTPECTQKYRFSSIVTADVQVYALWGKVYTFEAEHVDFDELSGPGYSGSADGIDMILGDVYDAGASGGYYVSYLYRNGNALDFKLKASEAVTDAKLILRLSAEVKDIILDSNKYQVVVNDVPVAYADIAFTNVPTSAFGGELKPFDDYMLTTSLSLKEGENTIRLVTNNSEPMGGIMNATAPLVDCIKIATTATVEWDTDKGYPINNKS